MFARPMTKRPFWQYEDNGKWEFMSPLHSKHIHDALVSGKTLTRFGQYEFDLTSFIQKNRRYSRVRRIRPYEFDLYLRWENQNDSGQWEQMSDEISIILQIAMAQGKTTAEHQVLKFDLALNTQINRNTLATTCIRRANSEPARDVPLRWEPFTFWEFEDDHGGWQPMPHSASEAIQLKLSVNEDSASYKVYTFNLMDMTQTNTYTKKTRRIRLSSVDAEEREALEKRRGYLHAIQAAARSPDKPLQSSLADFRWGVQQAFLAARTRHRRNIRAPPTDLCALPDYVEIRVEPAACGAAPAAAFARLLDAHPAAADYSPAARRLLADRVADDLHALLRAPWLGGPGPAGPDACDPRAVMGWHGTSDAAIDAILRGGYDPAHCGGGAGCTFGFGFYFAERSSKADMYAGPPARRFRKPPGPVRVLLCLLLCGPMHTALSGLQGAGGPPAPAAAELAALGAEGFGSVLAQSQCRGGRLDSREFVVYDPARALPVAVVAYAHASACACSRCCAE